MAQRVWMSRSRRAAANLGLLGVLLAMAVLLAEGVVRFASPQPLVVFHPELWRLSDRIGFDHAPNVRMTVNTGERTVTVVTDAERHRVGRGERPAAGTRSLVIGDSFMEALQVEYEQCLAGLLEERLPRVLGRPVAVVDAGVSGWQPSRYLAKSGMELASRHYDLVLVSLYLGNDIEDRRMTDLHEGIYSGALNADPIANGNLLVANLLGPLNRVLRQHSQLFALLKNRSRWLLTRLGVRDLDLPVHFLRSKAAASDWDTTAKICRDIADEAARHQTPTLFMLIPTHYQVETAIFRDYVEGFRIDPDSVDLDQPTRLLGAALRAQGLQVVDTVPALRDAHQHGVRTYGAADPHLSPAGHDVIERSVEPLLTDALRGVSHG